jgi:2-iminobutanoate/2-iminopropanoate deaminase
MRAMVAKARFWSTWASLLVAVVLLSPAGVWSMQERRVVADEGNAAPRSQAVVADGLIYVSGLRGTGGTVQAQTRSSLDRLKAALLAAGSSIEQAVSVFVQLKSSSDFDAMNTVYREYFTDQPPARTTIAGNFADDTLVEVSATAVPSGTTRETLLPAGWMKSPRPYSYIVRAGGLVFLSGLVSRRGTDDQFVPGWVRTQVKTILDNAGTLLKTAGVSYDDVVSARVFLTDDSMFEEMNDEYRKYFSSSPPARATAVTGLMGAEAIVEITLIATTSAKQVIGPVVSPSLPVSTAVRTGRRMFLSGVLGNTDTNAGNVAEQTREIFTRIQRTLELAGVSFADIVDSTVYLADPWQRAAVDKIYGEHFLVEPPARTVVGAKLVQRAGVVEIMMTAVK